MAVVENNMLDEIQLRLALRAAAYVCICGWTGFPRVSARRKDSPWEPDAWVLSCPSCTGQGGLVRTA